MSVMSRILRLGRLSPARRGGHFNDGSHPWMNAALKAVGPRGKTRRSRCWAVLGSAGRNENYASEVEALRCGNRIARKVIELSNESTSKHSNTRKGMCFTAAVLDEGGSSGIYLYRGWLVPPGFCILGFFQLCYELIKRRFAFADASA